MKYRPKNCMKCGGKKMQHGGSIVNLLASKNIDFSMENRKKMFDDYFGGKYTGTAEQNLQLIKDIESGKINIPGARKSPHDVAARVANSKSALKAALESTSRASSGIGALGASKLRPERRMESGIIVDKRTGKALIIKDKKIDREIDVLTGENVEGNKFVNSYIKDLKREEKVTPIGNYLMRGKGVWQMPEVMSDYEGLIQGLKPLDSANYLSPHNKFQIAIHQTPPIKVQQRRGLFGSASPYGSSGCINCKKPDMEYIMNMFPKGDTLSVIDSKMPEHKDIYNMYKKGKGGYMQKGGYPKREDYMDNEEAYQMAVDEYIAGLSSTQQQTSKPFDYSKIPTITNLQPIEAIGQSTNQLTPNNPSVLSIGNTPAPINPNKPDPLATMQIGYRLGEEPKEYVKEKKKPFDFGNLGMKLLRGTNLLSEISGRIARSRQNQYDYNQQTALGQMNAMPISDFQPSPYQLYAKYGGKLNDYRTGGIHIKPENRGKFTDYCGGKVTEECIQKGKNSPSSSVRKMATFADNARKWNKEDGGYTSEGFHIMPDGTVMANEDMKKGGLTPNKAREILHDGTAQGKKLTDKQRRFFGAMSKGHTNYRGK